MSQLVPFFFINQVIFAFILVSIIIYVFSKYILPRFVRLFLKWGISSPPKPHAFVSLPLQSMVFKPSS